MCWCPWAETRQAYWLSNTGVAVDQIVLFDLEESIKLDEGEERNDDKCYKHWNHIELFVDKKGW